MAEEAQTTALAKLKDLDGLRKELTVTEGTAKSLEKANKATRKAEKKAKKEIKKQITETEKDLQEALMGTDASQIVGDIAGIAVGETAFQLIQLAFRKLGLKSMWFQVIPGAMGTALYWIFWPKRNDGKVRASLRGTGLVLQIDTVHETVNALIASYAASQAAAAKTAAEVANAQKVAAENQQLQAALQDPDVLAVLQKKQAAQQAARPAGK